MYFHSNNKSEFVREEIKSKLNSMNDYCQSVQNCLLASIFSQSLLSGALNTFTSIRNDIPSNKNLCICHR